MLKSTLARLRQARASELEEEGASEAGFTLIELMVVLLIIAILLAIAIPTFLGVSGSANDRAAQSNLTNGLTEVKALFQNSQSYLTASLPAATLTASAPEFSWVQAGTGCATTAAANCVSEYPVDVVSAADGNGVILAALSKTGVCWYSLDLEAAPSATTFTDTGGTVQFLAGTAAGTTPTSQKQGAAGLTSGGVYYSQHKLTGAQTCNASTPTANPAATNPAWNWGISYSTAPVD
jgi:type IV pilus assembly protein PilA